jgi:WD40 repeat protein
MMSQAAPAQSTKVELRIQLGGGAGLLASVAFSPDGRFVLTASGGSGYGGPPALLLWEVDTGREIRRFDVPWRVRSVTFSPDGLFVLAGTEGYSAVLWEVATGREIRRFDCKAYCLAVAFSADGRFALTGSDVPDKTARLWDVASGQEVRALRGHTDSVQSVAFSRDGRYVITGSNDKTARLWEAATGRESRVFKFADAVTSVAFSPDGRSLMTGSRDNARLWDAATGREIRRFGGASDARAFSRDGRSVLEADLGGFKVRLWDVATGREVRVFDGGGSIRSVAFSPDGQSVLAADGTTARQWDATTGREIRRFEGHASPVDSVAISSDRRWLLINSRNATADLWEPAASRLVQRFKANFAALSPDSQFVLTVAGNGPIVLSDVATGREIRRLEGSQLANWAVFSPDSRSLLSGNGITDKSARLWDVATGREIRRFEGRSDGVFGVSSVAFSPDGRSVLTCGLDNFSRLWDVETGREIRRFELKDVPLVDSVAFSPDGRLALAQGRTRAILSDVATGREIRQLNVGDVRSLVFTPNSRWVLGGGRLWDVETGSEIRRFEGSNFGTFSSDGRWILTGSWDGTSKLWEATTGRLLTTLVSFRDGGWVVVDSEGRYDASDPDNSPGLYWLRDGEVIELKQLKERFYAPALLSRVLNGQPLPQVQGLNQLQRSPEVEITAPSAGQSTATIRLTNRGGGIGRTIVKVNGREIPLETSGRSVNSDARTAELTVDLSAAELAADGNNTIEVIPHDKANFVAGRSPNAKWQQQPAKPTTPPVLHAIIAGVSTYENDSMNLKFPAKDAIDIAKALEVGGRGLFGVERVHISTFASGTSQEPTKDNIRLAFENVAQSAGPNDVVLVYFAGHGVAGKAQQDTYYYLTRDARSFDLENDATLREKTTISSTDLLEWLRLKGMPLREVVVLDTCAAGAAANELLKLADRRELTPDQKRAIELLKDATGSHILMGSAADRVSYEASRFGQGLLTYALLLGMRGEALDEGGRLDVRKWFDTAQHRVPEFAQGIGGIQQPIISSPKGQTFPIALLTPAARAEIPLPVLKPQLLRLQVLDANDADQLDLADPVRAALRAASIPAARGETRQETALVYLDQVSDGIPDAYRPQIRYTLEANGVQLSIRLLRGGQRLAERTVALPTRNVTEISQRVVTELIQMLATQKP